MKHVLITAFITSSLLAGNAVAHGEEEHGHANIIGNPGRATEVNRIINVDMADNMRFTPAKIAVKKGETIRFVVKNSGQVRHEMVLGSLKELKEHAEQMRKHPEMEHDDPNQVQVDPGKTGEFIWKFTNAGTFDFACLQPGHFEAGMQGNVAVK